MAIWKCPRCASILIVPQESRHRIEVPRCGTRACGALLDLLDGDDLHIENQVWKCFMRATDTKQRRDPP